MEDRPANEGYFLLFREIISSHCDRREPSEIGSHRASSRKCVVMKSTARKISTFNIITRIERYPCLQGSVTRNASYIYTANLPNEMLVFEVVMK